MIEPDIDLVISEALALQHRSGEGVWIAMKIYHWERGWEDWGDKFEIAEVTAERIIRFLQDKFPACKPTPPL